MLYSQVETTFICQLNKPKNRVLLEQYRDDKDKSPAKLARYYRDIIRMLKDTPAWGVAGVNDMINELTNKVRATLNKAKTGKTSAYAHAGKLLRCIDYHKNEQAKSKYNRCALAPLITEEELLQLELMA